MSEKDKTTEKFPVFKNLLEARSEGHTTLLDMYHPCLIGLDTLLKPLNKEEQKLLERKLRFPKGEHLFKNGKILDEHPFLKTLRKEFTEYLFFGREEAEVNTVLLKTFWGVFDEILKRRFNFTLEELIALPAEKLLPLLKEAAEKEIKWSLSLAVAVILYGDYKDAEVLFEHPMFVWLLRRYFLFSVKDLDFPTRKQILDNLFSGAPFKDLEEVARVDLRYNTIPLIGAKDNFYWSDFFDFFNTSEEEMSNAGLERFFKDNESEDENPTEEEASEKTDTSEKTIRPAIIEAAAGHEAGEGLPKERETSEMKKEVSEEPTVKPIEERVTELRKILDKIFLKSGLCASEFIRESVRQLARDKSKDKKRIPIKENLQVPPEEGVLYTGFLGVVETSSLTFYNFYPKFIWVKGKPKKLTEEEIQTDFPDYGSVLIERPKAERRKLPFLQDGSLINVRVRETFLTNSSTSGSKGSKYYLHLKDLVIKNDICLSSDAPQCYRAFFVAHDSDPGNKDLKIRLENPISWAPSNETERFCGVLKTPGNEYAGPFSFERVSPNLFKEVNNSRVSACNGTLRVFEASENKNLFSFTQKSPNLPPTSYEIIFTGAQICQNYYTTPENEEEIADFFSDLSKTQDKSLSNFMQALGELERTFPEDPNFLDHLDRLAKSVIARVERQSFEGEVLNHRLTTLLLNRWAEAMKRNSPRADSLALAIRDSEAAFSTLLEDQRLAGPLNKKVEEKKAELEKLKRSLTEEKSEFLWQQRKKQEAMRDLEKLCELKDLNAAVRTHRSEKKSLEAEVSRLADEVNSLKEQKEGIENTAESYRKEIDDLTSTAAEIFLKNDFSRKVFGLQSEEEKKRSQVTPPRPSPAETAKEEVKTSQTVTSENKEDSFDRKDNLILKIPTEFDNPEVLVRTLCDRISSARSYDHNDIINILSCLSTGVLTVFAGAPGCGKTSLSDILGTVFGLNSLQNMEEVQKVWGRGAEIANRYLSVAVERGWTSKRDFIGYYNPINNSFECGDPQRYEFVRTLDVESRNRRTDLPYLVLLDEANLSPMEYYFADFMNIGEGRGKDSFVALGDHKRYRIGSNLRFIATINSDHTTERLSPRLLDRSWIVSLPEAKNLYEEGQSDSLVEPSLPMNWDVFLKAFSNKMTPQQTERWSSVLAEITKRLERVKMRASRRSSLAVLEFVCAASPWMEAGTKEEKELVAFDYAVSQRLLPQIDVFGDFSSELEELRNYFAEQSLLRCEKVISKILETGEELKGFSYF